MTVAGHLAQTLVGTGRLPADVAAKAVDAIQDLTAAAIAGLGTPAVEGAHVAARQIWGAGPAACWFSGERLTVPGAAYVNSTLAAVMDLDDGHRAAIGHPGAGIVPAVLATCDAADAPFERVNSAIAIGYEVAVRIAASRDVSKLTTMVSGPWVGQGVAAAAAFLRELPANQMAQAIAIAGSTAPNLQSIGYSKYMGNHLKEGISWATVTGLSAVELAAAGFTGPLDILDNSNLYRPDVLMDGLGEDWALREIYFKPYSCCRWGHAAMDAALQLRAEHGFTPSDILNISIETFDWALRLNNEIHPQTLESAQYSIPFCVALVLCAGADACLPMTEHALSDPAVLRLAGKVHLTRTERFEAMFPKAVAARLTVNTASSSWSHEVLSPSGEPTNPMTEQQMRKKFRRVAAFKLGAEDADRMERAIDALRKRNLAKFKDDLYTPLPVYSGTTRLTG